ncbi:hypothetical protein Mycsm_06693 (plasmid) [Mycobacterium sp. JS623]|uniref:hypothetical protein n=1 Tax=Mycobacterium sp. JS623 TaxID=212767 RepID=UPI0002A574CA|nr:hypothetical protein [Mycobacterium sp. JS623]AGB26812.1 hypothetical protein Mycsm_06693 [Mycobacterium sp. JS623]
MATPSMPPAAVAQGSDSLQAAYFRGALADQRALIAAHMARQSSKLQSMTAAGANELAITRLRRQVRENEAEIRQLDRMIGAIDRRFSASWTITQS